MLLLLFFISCIAYFIIDRLRDKIEEFADDKEHELVDNKIKFTFRCSMGSPFSATVEQLDYFSEALGRRLTSVFDEKDYWPGLLWMRRGFKIYHDAFSVMTVRVAQASAHEGETLALKAKPYQMPVDVTRQPSGYFWFKIAAATSLAAVSGFKEGSDPLWSETWQGVDSRTDCVIRTLAFHLLLRQNPCRTLVSSPNAGIGSSGNPRRSSAVCYFTR